MSSLELVLNIIVLNLSFTVKIFFFSFITSTVAFYKGKKDTFFSKNQIFATFRSVFVIG